jgi:hypothetical protein
MPEMTREQMIARIAELESGTPKARRAKIAAENREAKRNEKERKAKFKLEAWKRAHLHSSLNRYKL